MAIHTAGAAELDSCDSYATAECHYHEQSTAVQRTVAQQSCWPGDLNLSSAGAGLSLITPQHELAIIQQECTQTVREESGLHH